MPQARLHNCYSASEIGTLATVWNVTPEAVASGEVVIGSPVADTRIYIVDGEIYVGAPHLARGYLNQPEETARRFVMHNGERVFRTGDLGRLRPDGGIEFLGRVDEMVKIRGYRIELAEVERSLMTHEAVRDDAAAVHEIGGDMISCRFRAMESWIGRCYPRRMSSGRRRTATTWRHAMKQRRR